jgi:hypothetical protein
MAEHARASVSVEDLVAEVDAMEKKIRRTKELANLICDRAGIPPVYADVDGGNASTGKISIREDEFVNMPLNTAIKTLFARRKSAGLGPASAEEIRNTLIAGGYSNFPSNAEEAIAGLRISLGKSSHTFTRLNSGNYALAEWYGIKKSKKAGGTEKNGGDKAEEPSLVAEPQATQEADEEEQIEESAT